MQPFAELRMTFSVLSSMAKLRKRNPPAAECLDKAYAGIKDGSLRLSYLDMEPNLFYAEACGYMILVSDLGKTGVVVGLTPAERDLL